MKFLIVDGLRTTRLFYKELVESVCENAEIIQCMSAEDALFNVIDKEPDIIISSEILSFRNGFELVRILNKMKNKTPVIIIAEDDTSALQAIKNNVFDYIVMPLNSDKLKKSVANAVGHINKYVHLKLNTQFTGGTKLRINTIGGYKLINLDEVACFIANGAYTKVCYSNGDDVELSYNMGRIEEALAGYQFLRINRSVIINLNIVHQIDKLKGICTLEMKTGNVEFKINREGLRIMELNRLV